MYTEYLNLIMQVILNMCLLINVHAQKMHKYLPTIDARIRTIYSTRQKIGDISIPFHSVETETVPVSMQSETVNSIQRNDN